MIEKIDSLTNKDEKKDVLLMDGRVIKGSSRNKENTEEIKSIKYNEYLFTWLWSVFNTRLYRR